MCDDKDIMNYLDTETENVFYLYQFWVLLIMITLGRIAKSMATNLSDTICYQILGMMLVLFNFSVFPMAFMYHWFKNNLQYVGSSSCFFFRLSRISTDDFFVCYFQEMKTVQILENNVCGAP